MSKITIQVEVSESANALGEALYELAKVSKEALSDGWQPLSDIPEVLVSAVRNFSAAISAASNAAADIEEDKAAFIRGLSLKLEDTAALFI